MLFLQIDKAINCLLRNKEEIIQEAVNRAIGVDWKSEDLQGRGYITKSPNTSTVYFLDGNPIIMFGDPYLVFEPDPPFGEGATYRINYKFLDK